MREQQYKSGDNKEEQLKHEYKYKEEWGEYRFPPSWICILWESSLDIQSKYNQNKIKTQLKQNTIEIATEIGDDDVVVEDWLIICRINN
eukprot:61943_1